MAGVTITETGGSTDINEGGGADTYDVVLDSQPPTVAESPQVSAKQVEVKLDREFNRYDKLPEEEKRDKLDEKIERLEQVSSEESLDELATKFREWLGTEQRAQHPAEVPVEGKFDFDTAQIYDVRRGRGSDGRWQYHSILLDAEGRTMEVQMGAAEGERVYRTMQTLKDSPLAEKIYREITMPLMDKVIKAREQLEEAARNAEPAPVEQEPVEEPSTTSENE